ncbi:MAG TPA: hypothetical protein VFR85_12000 [Anaeromyxobacteraceae bacterium]|nr:hypothetical protein [Anaeromyxobacteraceae bacterium]
MSPLRIQILTYAPTAFFQCRNCEVPLDHTGLGRTVRREQLEAGLPEEMLEEYGRVSDWVRRLAAQHGERIALEVIDVASVRGFWKALRHHTRRYPAVIVDGRLWPDLGAAEAAVARRLAAA